MSDEVDVLHADKHQNFLHADKHQNFLNVDKRFSWFLRVFPSMSKVPRKVYNIFEIFPEQS